MTDLTNSALPTYLLRTRALLADIGRWSQDLGLRVQHGEVSINEERHGQYHAPALSLRDGQGKLLAEVKPFGESILGSWGRVDMIGEYGRQEKIVYLSAGGPSITTRIQVGEEGKSEESARRLYHGVGAEGWYWVAPYPLRRAYPVTQEVFIDLLSAVSSHEF